MSRLFPAVFLLTPVLACLATPSAAKARSVPGILRFDGHELWLKYTQGTPDGAYTAEYLPKDATRDDWTERLTIRIVLTREDPEAVAEDVVNRVNARKGGDRFAAASAYAYGIDGSAVADYTVSDGNNDAVEHDVHRYFKSGDRLVTYQYARRFWISKSRPGDAETFFSESAAGTPRYLAELDRPDLPLKPPPGEEEKLIRAAIVKKLAQFEVAKEDKRAAVRRDFREKRLSGTEAMAKLKVIDVETAPPDDALAALRPMPLKPHPPVPSKVKPAQRETL